MKLTGKYAGMTMSEFVEQALANAPRNQSSEPEIHSDKVREMNLFVLYARLVTFGVINPSDPSLETREEFAFNRREELLYA